MNKIKIALIFILLSMFAACAVPVRAQEVAGRDHPFISHMDGLKTYAVKVKNYDEYVFPLERHVWGKTKMKTQRVEGKVTRITYTGEENFTSFGIYRYYENELKNAGYTILFAARGAALGDQDPHDWYDIYYPGHPLFFGQFIDNVNDQYYINAKLPRPEGDIYVTLYTIPLSETKAMAQLDVIETVAPAAVPPPSPAPQVTASGSTVPDDISLITAELMRTGHYPVYGIEFNDGKAAIKPGSEKTLKIIADLLASNPGLDLYIVGATDNLQPYARSMEISRKRADMVARVLVFTYKVSPSRVQSAGVGSLWPVVANQKGFAEKNNRIELVVK